MNKNESKEWCSPTTTSKNLNKDTQQLPFRSNSRRNGNRHPFQNSTSSTTTSSSPLHISNHNSPSSNGNGYKSSLNHSNSKISNLQNISPNTQSSSPPQSSGFIGRNKSVTNGNVAGIRKSASVKHQNGNSKYANNSNQANTTNLTVNNTSNTGIHHSNSNNRSNNNGIGRSGSRNNDGIGRSGSRNNDGISRSGSRNNDGISRSGSRNNDGIGRSSSVNRNDGMINRSNGIIGRSNGVIGRSNGSIIHRSKGVPNRSPSTTTNNYLTVDSDDTINRSNTTNNVFVPRSNTMSTTRNLVLPMRSSTVSIAVSAMAAIKKIEEAEKAEKAENNEPRDEKGNTPIMVAILAKDEEKVKEMLKEKIKVDEVSTNEAGANEEKLEDDNGPDLSARNDDGDTPLHIAIRMGHEGIVRALLEHPLKLNSRNKEQDTALTLAMVMVMRATKKLKELKSKNTSNSNEDEKKEIVVDEAEKKEVVPDEVEKKEEEVVNEVDEEACIEAEKTLKRYETVLHVLLEKNPKFIFKKKKEGKFPIVLAIEAKNWNMVRAFISQGASLLVKDKDGELILFKMLYDGHEDEFVEFMKAEEKNTPDLITKLPTLRNLKGRTLLMEAIAQNMAKAAHLLIQQLKMDVNLNNTNENGEVETALSIATSFGYHDIMKEILSCPELEITATLGNLTHATSLADEKTLKAEENGEVKTSESGVMDKMDTAVVGLLKRSKTVTDSEANNNLGSVSRSRSVFTNNQATMTTKNTEGHLRSHTVGGENSITALAAAAAARSAATNHSTSTTTTPTLGPATTATTTTTTTSTTTTQSLKELFKIAIENQDKEAVELLIKHDPTKALIQFADPDNNLLKMAINTGNVGVFTVLVDNNVPIDSFGSGYGKKEVPLIYLVEKIRDEVKEAEEFYKSLYLRNKRNYELTHTKSNTGNTTLVPSPTTTPSDTPITSSATTPALKATSVVTEPAKESTFVSFQEPEELIEEEEKEKKEEKVEKEEKKEVKEAEEEDLAEDEETENESSADQLQPIKKEDSVDTVMDKETKTTSANTSEEQENEKSNKEKQEIISVVKSFYDKHRLSSRKSTIINNKLQDSENKIKELLNSKGSINEIYNSIENAYHTNRRLLNGDRYWKAKDKSFVVESNYIDIIEILLKRGVKVNKKDTKQENAILIASRYGLRNIVELLLRYGKNIEMNVTDKVGHTPLHRACNGKYTSIVKILLREEDINVNLTDADGDTPLMISVYNNHTDTILELLKSPKINIDILNKILETPLIAACRLNFYNVAKALIDHHALINNRYDANGETAIFHSIRNNSKILTKYLLNNGACITYTNKSGQTPLALAKSLNNKEVINILLKHIEKERGLSRRSTVDNSAISTSKLLERNRSYSAAINATNRSSNLSKYIGRSYSVSPSRNGEGMASSVSEFKKLYHARGKSENPGLIRRGSSYVNSPLDSSAATQDPKTVKNVPSIASTISSVFYDEPMEEPVSVFAEPGEEEEEEENVSAAFLQGPSDQTSEEKDSSIAPSANETEKTQKTTTSTADLMMNTEFTNISLKPRKSNFYSSSPSNTSSMAAAANMASMNSSSNGSMLKSSKSIKMERSKYTSNSKMSTSPHLKSIFNSPKAATTHAKKIYTTTSSAMPIPYTRVNSESSKFEKYERRPKSTSPFNTSYNNTTLSNTTSNLSSSPSYSRFNNKTNPSSSPANNDMEGNGNYEIQIINDDIKGLRFSCYFNDEKGVESFFISALRDGKNIFQLPPELFTVGTIEPPNQEALKEYNKTREGYITIDHTEMFSFSLIYTSDNSELLHIILKYGMNPNIQNNSLYTLLILACKKGHVKTALTLLDYNADPNHQNKYKETALLLACKRGLEEVVIKLLENKADVNLCNYKGESPLIMACWKKYINIVKLLIQNKADINQKNGLQETPLFIACFQNGFEIVKLLLENGADVNAKNVNNETPLHAACQNNNIEMVQLLLEKQADKTVINSKGETPLSIAKYSKNDKLIELLQ